MTDRKQLFSCVLLLLTPPAVIGEAAQCPANSAAIQYHSLKGSQIAISISVNHTGPYDFMVDTGAQITTIDPELAAELKLQSQGSIPVLVANSRTSADLAKANLVQVGPIAVRDLVVAVQELGQIQERNPKMRGILGENFLGRFDLLIDYGRKMICLDRSKGLETEMRGERVPMIVQPEQDDDPDYTPPVLVAVHVPGDGKNGTVLRVDSGSDVPVLFANQIGSPMMVQRVDTSSGRVAGKGGPLMFAAIPSQFVKISSHMTIPIAFQTAISAGHKRAKMACCQRTFSRESLSVARTTS